MKSVGVIVTRVATAGGVLAEALVFLMMLGITADIVARYVFSRPIPGQVEASTLALVVILYFGLAYTQTRRGHVRVELFVSRVSGAKRELLEALALAVSFVPTSLMCTATAKEAYTSVLGREFVSGVISFPLWPGRCAVAIGLALLGITLATQCGEHLLAALAIRQARKEARHG